MKLLIKQKVFSWRDRFSVYGEDLTERYQVTGELFTFGKKLRVCDMEGNEVSYISQRLFTFLPRYFISQNGTEIAEVKKELSFIKQTYSVAELGWHIDGSFSKHDYTIKDTAGRIVAEIKKQWFTWGDTYMIDISNPSDELTVLCTVIIIDAVMASESASTSGRA